MSSLCPTLTENIESGGCNVPIILTDDGIRKLTPRECFDLQGFDKNYNFANLSDSNLYKLVGNAISLPIVRKIALSLIENAHLISTQTSN